MHTKIQKIKLRYLILLLVCGFLVLPRNVFAQESKADEQLVLVADEMYNFGDVKDALEVYLQALEVNPENERANFMAGKSYLTTVQKDLALKYLLKAKELNSNISYDVLLLIGRAYHLNYEFDKAITYYEDYRTKIITDIDGVPLNDNERTIEEQRIERKVYECQNGKEYIKHPVNIELFNLGEGVNSPYKDYGPVANKEITMLYFTSRRKGSTGGNKDNDNEFFEDIYSSSNVSDQWDAAKNLGLPVNTPLHESCIGISNDGEELYLYVDNDKYKGDILYTKKDKVGNWSVPKSLSKQINTEYIENSMSLSKDGTTLFFSSNKPGGFGGQDIYVSKKDPKGEWGIPVNLGSYLNTEYDDEGPFLDANGKTLYFSSKGHRGMGGFDIYKTTYDSATSKWSDPENLLYPINSTDDDIYFVLSEDGVYGYFSSDKNIGYGDADIYRIRMPFEYFKDPSRKEEFLKPAPVALAKHDSTAPAQTTIVAPAQGAVEYAINLKIIDNTTGKPIEAASVEIIDMQDNAVLDKGFSTLDGYGRRLSFKDKTKLLVSVKKNGYLFQDISVSVDPQSSESKTISRKFSMEKPVVGSKYVLRNLYYDFDKTDLNPESETELQNLLKLMQSNITMRIEIGSHTDNLGTKEYNYALSQKRAQSVVNWLNKHGISKSRVEAKGYGEDEPLASNDDEEEGRALNRRTEVKILAK